MKRVSDILRAAMVEAERHGISLYRIAKQCELDDSIVYRFYHDQCGLALSSVDRLAEFLHLELRPMNEGRAAQGAGRNTASRGNRLSTLEPPAKRKANKRAAAEVKPAKKKSRTARKKKKSVRAAKKKKPRAK